MKQKEYRKLPGAGLRRDSFFELTRTHARLWQGKDHLLLQYNNGYSEDYKRFYYDDIQAFAIRKTNRFLVWNIILPVFAAAFVYLGYNYQFAKIPCYTIATVNVFFLFVNLILGPTCVCHLHTFVSEERLFSLNRLRTARKVINRLGPLVMAKQAPPADNAAAVSQGGT